MMAHKRKLDSDKSSEIRVGNQRLKWGEHIKPIPQEANEAYQTGDYAHVKHCLNRDGYILIRGALQKQTVLDARRTILEHLHTKNALQVSDDNDAMIAKDQDGKLLEGWTVDAQTGGVVGDREDDTSVDGWYNVGNSGALVNVYAGDQLQSFLQKIFGAVNKTHTKIKGTETKIETETETETSGAFLSTSLTPIPLPDCTWLRMKGRGEVTNEHVDYYYFRNNTDIFRLYWKWSRGQDIDEKQKSFEPVASCCSRSSKSRARLLQCTLCDIYVHASCLPRGDTRIKLPQGEWHCNNCSNQQMQYYTCWIPLGQVTNNDGSLCLIAGSHRLRGYHKPSRKDLLPGDYTKKYEKSSVWYTSTNMEPGDVILFNIKTVHAATQNQSDHFRLSCDTRVVVSSKPDTHVIRARDEKLATSAGQPRPHMKRLSMSMFTNNMEMVPVTPAPKLKRKQEQLKVDQTHADDEDEDDDDDDEEEEEEEELEDGIVEYVRKPEFVSPVKRTRTVSPHIGS